MQIILKPLQEDWEALLKRPEVENAELSSLVSMIFEEVRRNGDKAIQQFTSQFDKVSLTEIQVEKNEIAAAVNLVSPELKKALMVAKQNIERFHAAQRTDVLSLETTEGVTCWRKSVAIRRVGLYIPGGSAPLFSTVLMLGIPAVLAGCEEIVLCTPPNKKGAVHPAILFAASLCGISKIMKVGGVQAIAGLTFGTESIPKVDKIFGPGNQYVTKAKEWASQLGVAIDLPAGPSEVLIVSDDSADPDFVAADLLAQAEHGADSQVILLSTSKEVLQRTIESVHNQLSNLPRKGIAKAALKNSKAIQLETPQSIMQFSNAYAPEHLILNVENETAYLDLLSNAGSVFLGQYTPESAGDYASGTNHTLPTNGFAKAYSGVSLDSFVKKITFQRLTAKGLQNLGNTIEVLAENEQLHGHKAAISIRLAKLNS